MLYICHEDTQCEDTTVCNFDETDYRKDHYANATIIANSPSMLIKLWDTVELLDNTKPSDIKTVGSAIARSIYHSVLEPISDPIKQFLSSIHPEKLPFEEIEKRINT